MVTIHMKNPIGVYWLQGIRIVHCATYNNVWMGQMIQTDWDMFQIDHLCAKYHSVSRPICGGPIYVSDTLSNHDFELLNIVVYHDGTIPKCQYFALFTRIVSSRIPCWTKRQCSNFEILTRYLFMQSSKN